MYHTAPQFNKMEVYHNHPAYYPNQQVQQQRYVPARQRSRTRSLRRTSSPRGRPSTCLSILATTSQDLSAVNSTSLTPLHAKVENGYAIQQQMEYARKQQQQVFFRPIPMCAQPMMHPPPQFFAGMSRGPQPVQYGFNRVWIRISSLMTLVDITHLFKTYRSLPRNWDLWSHFYCSKLYFNLTRVGFCFVSPQKAHCLSSQHLFPLPLESELPLWLLKGARGISLTHPCFLLDYSLHSEVFLFFRYFLTWRHANFCNKKKRGSGLMGKACENKKKNRNFTPFFYLSLLHDSSGETLGSHFWSPFVFFIWLCSFYLSSGERDFLITMERKLYVVPVPCVHIEKTLIIFLF